MQMLPEILTKGGRAFPTVNMPNLFPYHRLVVAVVFLSTRKLSSGRLTATAKWNSSIR